MIENMVLKWYEIILLMALHGWIVQCKYINGLVMIKMIFNNNNSEDGLEMIQNKGIMQNKRCFSNNHDCDLNFSLGCVHIFFFIWVRQAEWDGQVVHGSYLGSAI